MKSFLILLSLVSSYAYAASSYYPADLQEKITKHQVKDDSLKGELFRIISDHHTAVGYGPAKRFLFGQLHLKTGPNGYFVEDVYCKKIISTGVGPGNVPDQNKTNTEHTWPQSKFVGGFPTEMQKSDIHHLFPTDSKANGTRGNFDFADVTSNQNLGADCQASKSGPSVLDGAKSNYFEPPTSHKGNVARALFYFSVRYKVAINQNEEETLKKWNEIDPVDQDEMDRNDAIQKIQGNRNPFIDFPTAANDISNF